MLFLKQRISFMTIRFRKITTKMCKGRPIFQSKNIIFFPLQRILRIAMIITDNSLASTIFDLSIYPSRRRLRKKSLTSFLSLLVLQIV